jgi:alanyl-tRNA synthetase
MKSREIRRLFLEYFQRNNHQIVASSSLIPAEDPTLLFANAGMNQFKDCFLGKEKRSYTAATTSQKCVRAGGKHNDLEQVGFTARHLTFFEMLGNFSFGQFFKKEAIPYAWNLLTKEYGLDPKKLHISVFREDDESYAIWHNDIGIPANHLVRLDEKDNFWAMGDTGPCGPCTEIYFDQGKELGCDSPKCGPGCDCDRFIEVWNLVFMQYNRSADGSMKPLDQPGVDTGMGLERLACVLQGKKDVFATDVFAGIKKTICSYAGIALPAEGTKQMAAFNVICDHVRSSSLLIADGCSPANDGRGYVLRKIIRRAILFAQKITDKPALLTETARFFIDEYSDIFPELMAGKTLILSILEQEVERFSANLVHGQAILGKYIAELAESDSSLLSGSNAFKLYDTYGFPLELTKVIAHEHSITVDEKGFAHEMARQQEQSKKCDAHAVVDESMFPEDLATTFTGYTSLTASSPILWEHTEGNARWIITKESPFYVESGGQVNDEGTVVINDVSYTVCDLRKVGARFSPAIAVKLSATHSMGPCAVGDTAHCTVNEETRMDTVRNHTATHMLHAALHEFLGTQAKQAGSVVNKEYLRFDYNHHTAPSAEIIAAIEQRVNEKIWENIETSVTNSSLEEAKADGVIAFFGEKYNPESVRVVKIPGFSQELCGGTHASRTGIIGAFKIVSDTALSTGTRRIFAVTGRKALALFQESYSSVKTISEQFKVKPEQVVEAVTKQTDAVSLLQSELRQSRKQTLMASLNTLVEKIDRSTAIPHLLITMPDLDSEGMRTIAQRLEQEVPGFYFIASNDAAKNKSQFLAWTSSEHQAVLKHADVMQFLKAQGLRGGGKPGVVQGGGSLISDAMIDEITHWITRHC